MRLSCHMGTPLPCKMMFIFVDLRRGWGQPTDAYLCSWLSPLHETKALGEFQFSGGFCFLAYWFSSLVKKEIAAGRILGARPAPLQPVHWRLDSPL